MSTYIQDFDVQISSVGRWGKAETFPPPEIGKIVVEIWCYLPEVYTFGAESEILRNI